MSSAILKVPDIINIISLRNTKKNNTYFTSVINNKQSILSFSTNYHAKECAYFIQIYRNTYGHYPVLNNEKEYISVKKKIKHKDIKGEIIVEPEKSTDLFRKCSLTNLGLVLIHNFNYDLSSNDYEVNFSAQEIDLDNIKETYSINELNDFLKL
jgi:hypothetical protein